MDIQTRSDSRIRSPFNLILCTTCGSRIFMYLQIFSITLMAGLWAGHVIPRILFSCFHCTAVGALPSWKIHCSVENTLVTTGPKDIFFKDICIPLRVYLAIDRYKCSNTIKCYTPRKHDTRNRADSFIILFSKTRFNPFLIVFSPDMNLAVFPNTNLSFIRKNNLFPIGIYRTMRFRTTPSPPLETVSISDE